MASTSTVLSRPDSDVAALRVPSTALAWSVFGLLLISNLPLFLCLPLTNDTALYDVQARMLLDGGVLYREIFETNLPGIIWLHAAVRSLLGWSSEAMRAADLLFLTRTVWMLSAWVHGVRRSAVARTWTVVVLVWFYFSISEWCHCQRDVWILPFALGALFLRYRQARRLSNASGRSNEVALWAVLEGMCWAAAFWIKPHVAVPALACWVVAAVQAGRPRRLAFDLAGLLAGGLFVGAAGIAWMWQSGAWPYFVDTFIEWNPRYVRAGKEHWTLLRFISMSYRMFPWILLHLAAVPLAAAWLARYLRWKSAGQRGAARRRRQWKALFAAFYLAWLLQSFALQHLFDYVHAPGILLAIALLAGAAKPRCDRWMRKPALAGFLLLAVVCSPALRAERLACWRECLAQGSTPKVRDRLAQLPFPNWNDLAQTAEYLRGLGLRDGELTCYNNSLIYLYCDLGLRPSTRYPYLESYVVFFPDQHWQFHKALEASPQRYIVTDLVGSGLSAREANEVGPGGPNAPPPALERLLETPRFKHTFPWRHPVVFRSGSILVHRVTSPLGQFVGTASLPQGRSQ